MERQETYCEEKPRWLPMPDTFGWWFFTPELKNWDFAIPIRVHRLESCDGEVEYDGFFIKEGRIPLHSKMGWWYGPIRVIRPTSATI